LREPYVSSHTCMHYKPFSVLHPFSVRILGLGYFLGTYASKMIVTATDVRVLDRFTQTCGGGVE
jgi:hypothetical protein